MQNNDILGSKDLSAYKSRECGDEEDETADETTLDKVALDNSCSI